MKQTKLERSRLNGPKRTEVDRIDQSGPNRAGLICFLSYEEEKLNLTCDNLDHRFEMQMTMHVAWGVPYIAHKQPPLPPIHKWYSMPVNYQMVLITSEQSTTEELLYPKYCFTRKAPHPKKIGNDEENNVTYTHDSSQINKYIYLWNKTGMLKTWSQWAWTQMAFPPPIRINRM